MALLKDGSLSAPLNNQSVIVPTPIFIPSQKIGFLRFRFLGEIPDEMDFAAYHEMSFQELEEKIGNVRDFVLFDEVNRYRINLPLRPHTYWSQLYP